MRFVSSSFAIVLALVAFGSTRSMAEEPRVEGPRVEQPRVEQPRVEQPRVEQQGTVRTEPHREAAPDPGRTWDAEKDSRQSADARVNPHSWQRAGAAATPESWRYRSHNGRWWYWTPQNRWMWYGDNGQWTDYDAETSTNAANAYVVNRPILASPLPEAKFSGGPITITNPATSKATLSYTLDATPIRFRRAIAKTCVKIGPG